MAKEQTEMAWLNETEIAQIFGDEVSTALQSFRAEAKAKWQAIESLAAQHVTCPEGKSLRLVRGKGTTLGVTFEAGTRNAKTGTVGNASSKLAALGGSILVKPAQSLAQAAEAAMAAEAMPELPASLKRKPAKK